MKVTYSPIGRLSPALNPHVGRVEAGKTYDVTEAVAKLLAGDPDWKVGKPEKAPVDEQPDPPEVEPTAPVEPDPPKTPPNHTAAPAIRHGKS